MRGLCFTFRPVRGFSSIARAGFGWPTRSRAFAFTAFAAENPLALFFATIPYSLFPGAWPLVPISCSLAFAPDKDEYGIERATREAPPARSPGVRDHGRA